MKYADFMYAIIDETRKRANSSFNVEDQHFLIGARGTSVSDGKVSLNDNQWDKFNDALFNVFPGRSAWGFRPATLDPGKVSAETLKKYGISAGEARLEEGFYTVRIGSHKGHVAFNQGSKFNIRRDANADGIWNENDPPYSGYFGINIHPQGIPKDTVGASSLGCTVTKATWDDPEWLYLIRVFEGAWNEARKKQPDFPGFLYAVYDQNTVKNILGV